jgi:predicted ester cyclase
MTVAEWANEVVGALLRRDVESIARRLSAKVNYRRGDGTSIEGRDALVRSLRKLFEENRDARLVSVEVVPLPPFEALLDWTIEVGGTRVVGADLLQFGEDGQVLTDEARVDTAGLVAGEAGRRAAFEIEECGRRYTEAWSNSDAAGVAGFYAETGSLRVNGGAPAAGRGAIARLAQGFMDAFPDLVLTMDSIRSSGDRAVYCWTFEGTNTGAGGTGKRVRFSGYEVWRMNEEGLVEESRGHFDSAGYARQVREGV